MQKTSIFKILKVSCIGVCGILSIACSSLDKFVYKSDIHQGNVITDRMLESIEIGDSREKILDKLGDPVLQNDPAKAWRYVHYVRRGDHIVQKRTITLMFEGQSLVKIDISPLAESQ